MSETLCCLKDYFEFLLSNEFGRTSARLEP